MFTIDDVLCCTTCPRALYLLWSTAIRHFFSNNKLKKSCLHNAICTNFSNYKNKKNHVYTQRCTMFHSSPWGILFLKQHCYNTILNNNIRKMHVCTWRCFVVLCAPGRYSYYEASLYTIFSKNKFKKICLYNAVCINFSNYKFKKNHIYT